MTSEAGAHAESTPDPGQMTPERLVEFFDACNDHDVDRIVGFFTPDGIYYASVGPEDDGTSFRGVEEIHRGFSSFLGSYPDGRYRDLQVFVHGDRGYVRWTFGGTSNSGERMSYRGVDVFEFDGDRISIKDAFRKERANPIGG